MSGMPLIPSESASFPDLIGHEHGFGHPKARRRGRKSAHRKRPELSNSRALAQTGESRLASDSAEQESHALSSEQSRLLQFDRGTLPDNVNLAQSGLAPEHDFPAVISPEYTEPDAATDPLCAMTHPEVPGVAPEALASKELTDDSSIAEPAATPLSGAQPGWMTQQEFSPIMFESAVRSNAPNISSAPDNPETSKVTAQELLLPLIFDQAPDDAPSHPCLAPLGPLKAAAPPNTSQSGGELVANSRDISSDLPATKTPSSGTAQPVSARAALPPRKSAARSRATLQRQEPALLSPANRPRTPVRGLTIIRPRATIPSRPTTVGAARIPVLKINAYRMLRFVRFLACEAIAISVLLFIIVIGLRGRSEAAPGLLFLKVLAGVSAFVAIALPVIFYGLPERDAESDR